MSIYAALANRAPATYPEIGSGNSTLFAGRAVTDQNLSTKIVAIDPNPRADVDAVYEKIIREPFEKVSSVRLSE
jgi:hypothetical protein